MIGRQILYYRPSMESERPQALMNPMSRHRDCELVHPILCTAISSTVYSYMYHHDYPKFEAIPGYNMCSLSGEYHVSDLARL